MNCRCPRWVVSLQKRKSSSIVHHLHKSQFLLADTKLLAGDDGAITVDVLADEIIEQAATLTYQHLQCTLSRMIFFVDLQVFGQVGDTDRE